jgi:type I restriction enzyme S subunit
VSELFVIIGGGTPTKNNSRYWGGNINWASVKDIKSQYILTTEDKITTEGVESSSTKIANAGDVVLVTRISPGQVSIVKSNTAINQDLKILKLFGGMNPSFVYFLLLSQNQQFLKNASGTTVKGIKVNSLKNIVLPLPPLQEQHRIVSKIDTLFSELDHAEKGLQNVKHQLGIYKQALLKSAFNGSITAKWRAENEEKSAYEELESIKRIRKKRYNLEIQQGNKRKIKTDYNITFKQDEEIPTWVNANLNNLIDINARIGWRGLTKKEYTTEGPLFLSVHSLNYGKNVVFNDANHITNARYEESPEIKLQVNDLLLCKDGAGIGKVGIIKSLPDKATVNSSLLVINAKEVFNPDFLYYFFSGPTMQELVNDKISGSAIPHLFQKDIKKFNLKVPPKEEQNEIVDVLESRFTLVENLEKSINDSLSKALVFRHSILKKAFEGKLVEQNPNDEPAELLLQKIKKEKGEFLTVQKVIDKLIPKKKRHMEAKKTVFEILRELKEPISTQELWTNSIHEGDIESFYSEIKEIYDQLDEMKESTESFLSLKK